MTRATWTIRFSSVMVSPSWNAQGRPSGRRQKRRCRTGLPWGRRRPGTRADRMPRRRTGWIHAGWRHNAGKLPCASFKWRHGS